jgi:hypothetical protein
MSHPVGRSAVDMGTEAKDQTNKDTADDDYCCRMGQALLGQIKDRDHLGIKAPEIEKKQNEENK